jgi:predicted nucleotidyltransferase
MGMTSTAMEERSLLVQRLHELLKPAPDLIAAYLFGSVAAGKAHKQSDIDVALLFSSALDRDAIFSHSLAMGTLLESELSTRLDVVALNLAPLLLQFKVFQNGVLIVEHDRTARCLYQMRTMGLYYDALPTLRYHQEQTVRRIQEQGLGHGYQGHRNALAEARRLRTSLTSTARSAAG